MTEYAGEGWLFGMLIGGPAFGAKIQYAPDFFIFDFLSDEISTARTLDILLRDIIAFKNRAFFHEFSGWITHKKIYWAAFTHVISIIRRI